MALNLTTLTNKLLSSAVKLKTKTHEQYCLVKIVNNNGGRSFQ